MKFVQLYLLSGVILIPLRKLFWILSILARAEYTILACIVFTNSPTGEKFCWKGCFIFWNGFPKVSLNLGFVDINGKVKNLSSKMKGAFVLGLVLVVAFASTFVLSASAADQTRDRAKDQVQDYDCVNDCTCDGTPEQIRDGTQDQVQDRICTQDCTAELTCDRNQDRVQDRDCTTDCVKDQTQLRTRQQTRGC